MLKIVSNFIFGRSQISFFQNLKSLFHRAQISNGIFDKSSHFINTKFHFYKDRKFYLSEKAQNSYLQRFEVSLLKKLKFHFSKDLKFHFAKKLTFHFFKLAIFFESAQISFC